MSVNMNRRTTLGGLATLITLSGMGGGEKAIAMTGIDPKITAQLAPSGRLKVAINLGNVVLAQKGGEQGAKGPSVDIANELGRRLGVPVELLLYETAGLVVSSLDKDHWDIAFMGIDPARADQIAFTAPYIFIEGTYMVKAVASYQSVAELDRTGVRIAVGKGAAYDLYLTRTLKQATIVRLSTSPAAIEQFRHDDLEAVAGVRQALVDAAKAVPGYRVLPDSFNRIEQAVAVPKGRAEGLAFVADFIEELKGNGFVRHALDRADQNGVPVAPLVNH